MAVTYGFYNALNHDRLYDAIQMSSIFDGIIRDGIFSTIGDTMIVTAPEDGMYVNVGSGRAWFNHTWTLNDTDYPIEAEQAEVVLDRIDAVILEVNSSAEVRANSIKFLKGTPSSNPVKPTLTHNAEVNQYALAYVRIKAGQTTIFQSDIENAVGTDETPLVTGVLQQVSIETLLKQWEAEFNTYFTNFKNTSTTEFNNWFAAKVSEYTAWFAQMQTDMDSNFNEFDAWFQRMKDQLDENQAGHLQLQIDTLNSDINALEAEMPFAGGSKVNINFEYDVDPNVQYSNEHYKLTVGDTVRENNFSSSKLHFDEYGILTVGDGVLEVTYDVTDSRTGKVTHASYTYTINMPYFGRFVYNVTISASLYDYQGWLYSIGKNPSQYSTIEDVFADEKLLRELMTRHTSVDYLVEWLAYNNEDAHTVLNNDYCAKWINLRDYALDMLYANPTVKAVMDEVDKYGYGEWALVGQVPKMTSNTAPSGEAFSSSIYDSNYEAWKAFNGTVTDGVDCWHSGNRKVENEYIGYKFIKPTRISRVVMINRNGSTTTSMSAPKNFSIQGSNDGVNWTTLAECTNPTNESKGESSYDVIDSVAYSMCRLLVHTAYDLGLNIGDLQFYAWQPKGLVPIMTSNNAPYGECSSKAEKSGYPTYKLFDGDDTTAVESNNGTKNDYYIQYRFVVPTKVNRIKVVVPVGTSSRDYICNVVGSNDGSNWETVASNVTFPYVSTESTQYKDIANDKYYLYYRLETVQYNCTYSNGYCSFYTLQFYGRQLNVSVPKMTSNTAPWGEVYNSTHSNNFVGLNAFNGKATDNNNRFLPSDKQTIQDFYIGYNFTKLTKVNIVRFKIRTSAEQNPVKTNYKFRLQGSNDGTTWENVSDAFSGISTTSYVMFTFNTNATKWFKMFRLIIDSADVSYSHKVDQYGVSIGELQFYGLDYSEREFEEGSTMKYLYDHGVELEPIDGFSTNSSSAFYAKEPNQLYVNKTANGVMSLFNTTNGMDISPYNLLRGIAGDKFSYTGGNVDISIRSSHNNASQTISENILSSNFNQLPNNIFLDVSSINSVAYPVMTTNGGGTVNSMSLTEWWLE